MSARFYAMHESRPLSFARSADAAQNAQDVRRAALTIHAMRSARISERDAGLRRRDDCASPVTGKETALVH
jgi:hypothetical protein